jgi:hypothetical protein
VCAAARAPVRGRHQGSEPNRRHSQEVDGNHTLYVVLQESTPGLRGRSPMANDVLTLVSPMSIPSLSNSPWIRGAPQRGCSRLIVRIKARISFGTAGRPRLPQRIFQVQNRRKPFRCQPMTVDALTRKMFERQSFQTAHSPAHRSRSVGLNLDRLTERRRTPS